MTGPAPVATAPAAPEPLLPWPVPVLFAGLAVALYRRAVFGGEQFFYRDLALQWHPQVEAFVHAVGAGSWPLWNPFISFGQPLLANPNAQLLYPVTWLQLLLPAWTFYTWYTVLHVAIGGCGAYALGRRLGLSREGGITAGVLYVLAGPFLSLQNLWHHFAGAAWLPWAVRAGDLALERFSLRRSVLWGALIATIVVAGSPETPLMVLAVNGALALRFAPDLWSDRRRGAWALGGAGLALAGAALLSAGQWLPTLDVARFSSRADLPQSQRDFWSVHPIGLAQLALPVFADRLPLRPELRERLFESREPFLHSLYLGLPALALVAAGLWGARRSRWPLLLAGLGAILAMVAVGRHLPVYPALTTLVPPLRSLRYPVKAMIPVALCAALIAGRGFDAWRAWRAAKPSIGLGLLGASGLALLAGALLRARADEWGPALLGYGPYAPILAPVWRGLLAAGSLGALAAVLALVPRVPRRAAALAAVAALDLAIAERGLNPTAPPGVLAGRPPVLEVASVEPFQRTFVHDYARGQTAQRLLGHAGFAMSTPLAQREPWHAERALFTYAHPALLGFWGREGSYGVDALKLLSRDVNTVNALVEMSESSPAPLHRLLRLGAVGPVIALHRAGFEELTPVAELPSLFPEPIRVFRVPDPLPRAYVVGRARVAPPGQGWRALLAPDFDPAREIVLPEGPVLESDAPPGAARIVEMRPDRVTLESDLAQPGYVVLVDAYDPGWTATIDGRRTPLLRANVAFRAVQAPPGRHLVRFVYSPASVTLGLALTALGAAAALGAWLKTRRPAAA